MMVRLIFFLLLASCHGFIQAQEQKLKVYTEQTKTAIIVYADNDKLYPQSTTLTLDLKGLKPSKKLEKYLVVPPQSSRYQLVELVIPKDRSWGYNYSFTYIMGDISVKHDDSYVYMLPYEEGKSFKIGQGYNGRSTHQGENTLDFNLPAGETITAARSGKVVRIKEDSNRGCPNESCAKLGNYVTIMHKDGTYAEYYHLKQNGVLVELGTEVEEGQPIGLTGNTGWATGYHLHFIVYKSGFPKRETIATQFKTREGIQKVLKESESYTAVN